MPRLPRFGARSLAAGSPCDREARVSCRRSTCGRLVRVIDPIGNTVSNAYDAAGNLRQKINANGQTNFMAYNALNQLTSRVSGARNMAHRYDVTTSVSGKKYGVAPPGAVCCWLI